MQNNVKKYVPTDNEDLLEAIDGAMASIKSAMGDLKGIPEYKGWLDALEDLYYEMKPEYEELNQWAEEQYEEEIAELNREYWASVL